MSGHITSTEVTAMYRCWRPCTRTAPPVHVPVAGQHEQQHSAQLLMQQFVSLRPASPAAHSQWTDCTATAAANNSPLQVLLHLVLRQVGLAQEPVGDEPASKRACTGRRGGQCSPACMLRVASAASTPSTCTTLRTCPTLHSSRTDSQHNCWVCTRLPFVHLCAVHLVMSAAACPRQSRCAHQLTSTLLQWQSPTASSPPPLLR